MVHRNSIDTDLATTQSLQLAEKLLDNAWSAIRPTLLLIVLEFLDAPLSPKSMLSFEKQLSSAIRSLGRLIVEVILNQLEPESHLSMPHDLDWQGSGYRRLRDKTANRYVATIFGTICLWRRGYRYWHRGVSEATIFPIELGLGLLEGITPALGDLIGKQMAAAGSTQSYVLQWLETEHCVSMGVKRLRAFTERLSQGMEQFQQQTQVETILAALQKAYESKGNRKPVLSVGRDGITLCNYKHRFYEIATVGTVAIFDRSGKRLTTVYLAHPPEANQTTMSTMLSTLLVAVFHGWKGALPQLAYVADSGGNESSFFELILKRMRHPVTGKVLNWQRVVDFYHAAQRIWTMAEVLFGKETQEGTAWARRMLKALKKPSGASRVLHSAATLRSKRELSETALKQYEQACAYIRKRTKFMRYDQYLAAHIPLGSGITEAACKTVFTQRLKLSGMRWTGAGAKRILVLRTCLLSKHWDKTYEKYLEGMCNAQPRTYAKTQAITETLAA
jgi:hypothetical protein